MSPPPPPWKDATSYPYGAKDRTPRTWRANFGVFNLILTRHVHYAADVWLAYCPGVFPETVMDSKEVYDAAAQALSILQFKLKAAIGEIHDCT